MLKIVIEELDLLNFSAKSKFINECFRLSRIEVEKLDRAKFNLDAKIFGEISRLSKIDVDELFLKFVFDENDNGDIIQVNAVKNLVGDSLVRDFSFNGLDEVHYLLGIKKFLTEDNY